MDRGLFEWIKRQDIYQEVDGFWVWSPNKTEGGFLNEYALTALTGYLKAKNAAWDWEINNDPAIGGSTADTGAKHE